MDPNESVSDIDWDVVIKGTGLTQSLLALSLSRSGKKVLHADANSYYGGSEAALELNLLVEWAYSHAATASPTFINASFERTPAGYDQLASSRNYSIAVSPQIINSKSSLLKTLVSSKVSDALEFLSVGSVFLCSDREEEEVVLDGDSSDDGSEGAIPEYNLTRVPCTRETIFATPGMSSRAKRALTGFMAFAREHDTNPDYKTKVHPLRNEPFIVLLDDSDFKLDDNLRGYIISLAMNFPDSDCSVKAGLAALKRHLCGIGTHGPDVAALYPRWGGATEICQVACRASAVGGGVYMLNTDARLSADPVNDDDLLQVSLGNGTIVKTRWLVEGSDDLAGYPAGPLPGQWISRLTVVVNSALPCLFKPAMKKGPTPAAVVVLFPRGTFITATGIRCSYPVYALVSSATTRECPLNQSVVYLSTISTTVSKEMLEQAISALLSAAAAADARESGAVGGGTGGPSGASSSQPSRPGQVPDVLPSQPGRVPDVLCRLSYKQRHPTHPEPSMVHLHHFKLPAQSVAPVFDDSGIKQVEKAWKEIIGDEADIENFMKFD